MMLDCKNYRNQLLSRIREFGKLSPETVHGCQALSVATSDEIAEAPGVAVAVNAGAALVYSVRVLDALAAQ